MANSAFWMTFDKAIGLCMEPLGEGGLIEDLFF